MSTITEEELVGWALQETWGTPGGRRLIVVTNTFRMSPVRGIAQVLRERPRCKILVVHPDERYRYWQEAEQLARDLHSLLPGPLLRSEDVTCITLTADGPRPQIVVRPHSRVSFQPDCVLLYYPTWLSTAKLRQDILPALEANIPIVGYVSEDFSCSIRLARQLRIPVFHAPYQRLLHTVGLIWVRKTSGEAYHAVVTRVAGFLFTG